MKVEGWRQRSYSNLERERGGQKGHRFSGEMFQTQKGPEPKEIGKRAGQDADGQGEEGQTTG